MFKKSIIGSAGILGFIIAFFVSYEVQLLFIFIIIIVLMVSFKIFKDFKGAVGIFIMILILFISLIIGLLIGDIVYYILPIIQK